MNPVVLAKDEVSGGLFIVSFKETRTDCTSGFFMTAEYS